MIKAATDPSGPARSSRWIEQLPLARDRPVFGVVVMLAIVTIAWMLRALADPLLPPGFPYVTFFPAVIITSFLFGVRLGSAAAVICGMLAWYYFIPPARGFSLTRGAGFALAFYVFVVVTDLALVHWMQSANRQLAREREVNRSLADTRELLFRELQHRVSNNLQVAASLLTMQKRQLSSDKDARAALDEAGGRLALIGSISRQLYDPSGAAQPLLTFLEQLCRDVLQASGRSDVVLDVAGDEQLRLQPDAAVPTALIVAEAMANALEHGLAHGRAGRIAVTFGLVAGGDLEVRVQDDGHGLSSGFRLEDSESLGLRIATMLARGQGGSFRLAADHGTTAILALPRHLVVSGA
ncbi:sensor histidine kinase [Sphingomonas jatrophae]|nr:histidine kinase dimerization/phosphoacceptor domain -containing protein [Sphingomonas jatrophae]